MSKRFNEIDEEKTAVLDKTFLLLLIGIGALISMWFLSGIYYVILK